MSQSRSAEKRSSEKRGKPAVVVGIDWADRQHVVCVLDGKRGVGCDGDFRIG